MNGLPFDRLRWNGRGNVAQFDKNAYFDSFEKYTGEEAMNEGAVLNALENKDYEEWKEATQNLEGYPKNIEPLPKEEFKTLAELKKAEEI